MMLEEINEKWANRDKVSSKTSIELEFNEEEQNQQ